MKGCAIIPAYDAERTVGAVVRAVRAALPEACAVFVIDDGSVDDTARVATEAGATLLRHPRNLGKGAALRTGMRAALAQGFEVAVSVDADAQHRAEDARTLLDAGGDPRALVLGIRDLVSAGAPRANQISNRISNVFLSLFTGLRLQDTQCGLRRYPLAATLALDGRDDGYAFEAEVILRAVAAGLPLIELPVAVIYPPERVTHFDSVKDPARIISRVVRTLIATRGRTRAGAPIVPSSATTESVARASPPSPSSPSSERASEGERAAPPGGP